LGYSHAENKLVTRDEVKKCLLEAMAGEKAEELKKNAMKWKKAAEDAVAIGGSSDLNLDAFMQDIKKCGTVNIQKTWQSRTKIALSQQFDTFTQSREQRLSWIQIERFGF